MGNNAIFKYISCYYLTAIKIREETAEKEFKYISCYYLTATAKIAFLSSSHSNTSHVII